MSDSRQIFTLQQVAASIKKTIEARYQQTYWVKAEMHKVNRYPSGHAFPELVQKEGDKIVAQMSGTIWNHHFERINKQFISIVKEPLKEGTLLLLSVKVSFSEIFGLSLQILDIDPSFSLGELQRERDETLKRLQKEGLLNSNQLLPFPLLPQRIAIISADTSKGLSDFMKVIEQNSWGYRLFTFLFPAYLQGDVAVSSIIAQLERIKKVQSHFDLVVIVRGGGGEVGLTCYNNYELCKAIATFPLPVLTGIGHSTNMTVAELVAFRNAITPTELADFLLQTFHDFSVPVNNAGKAIKSFALKVLELSKQQFTAETKHFKNASNGCLLEANTALLRASQQYKNEAKTVINRNREYIYFAQKECVSLSNRMIKYHRDKVEDLRVHFPIKLKQLVEKEYQRLNEKENMVRLMNPKNVLKRGFSITTINGQTVNKINSVKEGDAIKTLTYEYELNSIITKIEEHGE